MSIIYRDVSSQTGWNSQVTYMSGLGSDVSNVVVRIINDLTLTSGANVLGLKNATLDGQLYTITSTRTNGFIDMSGGTVKNLIVDGSGGFLNSGTGGIVSSANQWGNFDNVEVKNFNTTSSAGGFAYNFGSTVVTSRSKFTRCHSNMNLLPSGGNSGGFLGYQSRNIDMSNCYYDGVMKDVTAQLVGGFACWLLGTCNLYSCYSNTDVKNITSWSNGGFISIADFNGTINFNSCYFIGSVINDSGCFIGMPLNNVQVTFNNCYAVADVSSGSTTGNLRSGVFCGNIYRESGSVLMRITINNCYHIGTLTNASIYAGGNENNVSGSVIFDISNCRFQDKSQATLAGVTFNETNVTTNLNDISSAILPSWDNTIWQARTGNYPILRSFTDTDYWDGTYSNYTSLPELNTFATGGGGDPHIKPLFGPVYTLPMDEDSYLLFNNNNKLDPIMIIGKCWFLPEHLYEDKLNKYKRKGMLERYRKIKQIMKKATYFRYIKIIAKNKELIYDMETLNPVELTSFNDVLNHTLPEFADSNYNPDSKRIKVTKLKESDGLFRPTSRNNEYDVPDGKARERLIKIETQKETIIITLAFDKRNIVERNSINLRIIGVPVGYSGGLIKKEITKIDFITNKIVKQEQEK